jgi:hypothetical protein
VRLAAAAALALWLAASGDAFAARKDRAPPPRQPQAVAAKLPQVAPFPRPRPGRAKPAPAVAAPAVAAPAAPPPAESAVEALQEAAAACLKKLPPELAIAHPMPPVDGEGECGIPSPVRLEAVLTRAGKRIALRPAAVLRCEMAEALVHWVRDELDGAVQELAGPLGGLVVDTSYECRGRNRVVGARMSEHGVGNAVDLRAVALADGKLLTLTDTGVAKELRTRLQGSACTHFTTVLGPGSDGAHENHVHLDIRARRGGHRICQWDVR